MTDAKRKKLEKIKKISIIAICVFGLSAGILAACSHGDFKYLIDYSAAALILALLSLLPLAYVFVALQGEAEKKLKEQQKVIQEKLEARKKLILTAWDDNVGALGCDSDSAITVDGETLWFNRKKLYCSQSRQLYLESHNLNAEAFQVEPLPCTFIPVERIQYFSKTGDVQYTTKISGGGGGGSSIGGAIVGGLIAGGTGAIIGSRQKIQEVVSETEAHDSRKTVLRYYDDSDALREICYNGFTAYSFFLKHIPDKDLLTIQIRQVKSTEMEDRDESIREKLCMLKSLHDEGLISDVDYEEKKTKLLEKL